MSFNLPYMTGKPLQLFLLHWCSTSGLSLDGPFTPFLPIYPKYNFPSPPHLATVPSFLVQPPAAIQGYLSQLGGQTLATQGRRRKRELAGKKLGRNLSNDVGK